MCYLTVVVFETAIWKNCGVGKTFITRYTTEGLTIRDVLGLFVWEYRSRDRREKSGQA